MKETKDFLFLNYSWVWGSSNYFKYFETKGHSIILADEKNIDEILSKDEFNYKNIVVYYHDSSKIAAINNFILKHPESFLIHHDDTDHEHIQPWTRRKPDLIMKREVTTNTDTKNNLVYTIHFPMNSIYQEQEKEYDLCFVGGMTHSRRAKFIEHLNQLKATSLKDLKFLIDFNGYPGGTPGIASNVFRDAANKSKIGLHYYGNSYDATRIWEILSCNTALLMPPLKSPVKDMPLDPESFVCFREDYSDLEEKILYLLKDDKWKEIASKGQKEFENHKLEKCCEYYYNTVMKHCNK
jgi:hypothetical protein